MIGTEYPSNRKTLPSTCFKKKISKDRDTAGVIID